MMLHGDKYGCMRPCEQILVTGRNGGYPRATTRPDHLIHGSSPSPDFCSACPSLLDHRPQAASEANDLNVLLLLDPHDPQDP